MKIAFSTGYAHESIISINTRTSIKVNGKSLCRVYLGSQTLAPAALEKGIFTN